MIIDIPKPEDFKSIATEWLVQSFQIIYDYGDELEYLEDWEDSDWHFHKGKLSTALVLIHQAIEAQMKAEICNVSPYFLLDLKQQDWPTLPDSRDKSFNELFTIGAESLIRVYLGVCDHKKDKKVLTDLFEEIRVKRNKIIHGLAKDILEPKYLLELQFKTAKELFDNDLWTLLKKEERRHPLYTELEDEDLISVLYYKLNFIEKYFGLKKLKKFIGQDGRNYQCPNCTRKAQNWDHGSIYLNPNSPESTSAVCIICDFNFTVQRKPCDSEDCKGNVIWNNEDEGEMICLTCQNEVDAQN